jgi:hypothetical protein
LEQIAPGSLKLPAIIGIGNSEIRRTTYLHIFQTYTHYELPGKRSRMTVIAINVLLDPDAATVEKAQATGLEDHLSARVDITRGQVMLDRGRHKDAPAMKVKPANYDPLSHSRQGDIA